MHKAKRIGGSWTEDSYRIKLVFLSESVSMSKSIVAVQFSFSWYAGLNVDLHRVVVHDFN